MKSICCKKTARLVKLGMLETSCAKSHILKVCWERFLLLLFPQWGRIYPEAIETSFQSSWNVTFADQKNTGAHGSWSPLSSAVSSFMFTKWTKWCLTAKQQFPRVDRLNIFYTQLLFLFCFLNTASWFTFESSSNHHFVTFVMYLGTFLVCL